MIKNLSTTDVKSGSQVLIQCEHFFLHSIIGPILLVSEWAHHKVCSHVSFSSRNNRSANPYQLSLFSLLYIAFYPGKLPPPSLSNLHSPSFWHCQTKLTHFLISDLHQPFSPTDSCNSYGESLQCRESIVPISIKILWAISFEIQISVVTGSVAPPCPSLRPPTVRLGERWAGCASSPSVWRVRTRSARSWPQCNPRSHTALELGAPGTRSSTTWTWGRSTCEQLEVWKYCYELKNNLFPKQNFTWQSIELALT